MHRSAALYQHGGKTHGVLKRVQRRRVQYCNAKKKQYCFKHRAMIHSQPRIPPIFMLMSCMIAAIMSCTSIGLLCRMKSRSARRDASLKSFLSALTPPECRLGQIVPMKVGMKQCPCFNGKRCRENAILFGLVNDGRLSDCTNQ